VTFIHHLSSPRLRVAVAPLRALCFLCHMADTQEGIVAKIDVLGIRMAMFGTLAD
jgi:hypothetical protein